MERTPRERATLDYLDAIFGSGAGEKHLRFLASIANDGLRDALHDCHAMEADTRLLSVEENYLLGMTVLAALGSHGTAAMFAKTLLHRGVAKEKLLEAIARLAMWIGPVRAVEAALHVQRAIREFDAKGEASLEAWFPNGNEARGPRSE